MNVPIKQSLFEWLKEFSQCFRGHGEDAMHYHLASTRNWKLETRNFSNGFTLLELIVVIGILSVLLAIILPIPRMVRTAALKKRAKAEATALAQAAIRYKAEYNFWPGEIVYESPGSKLEYYNKLGIDQIVGVIVSGPREFTQNIKTLQSAPGSSSLDILRLDSNQVYRAFSMVGYPQGGGYDINPLNPKAIPFLELKNEADIEIVNYPDPWGQPYRLIMGLNPKSRFEFTVTAANNPNTILHYVAVSNVTAFAFSAGPGGRGNTNYIYSAGVGL